MKDKYIVWQKYLDNNVDPKAKTLSIASGRCINELKLISNNFNITCSDIEVPKFYERSKKIFGDYDYIKFNITKDEINNKFDCIYSLSVFYIFSNSDLEKIINNINKVLNKDGVLILDHGGVEDNLTSYILHEIYLIVETYLIYYWSKILNKKFGFKFDKNWGYRRKNEEIIQFIERFGFELININEYDELTELKRSFFIRSIIKYIPYSTKIFKILGKNIPYIRIFKFKKI